MLFDRQTFSMGAATGNHVEVADFVNSTQVRIFNPGSEGNASNRVKPKPPTLAERDLILMVIGDRTLRLISDQ